MARAVELVARYGYLAIFGLLMLGIVGPLIPDETILVFAGILVREGRMDYVAVLAAGYAGSLCGITMSYFVGRKGLLYLIERMPFVRSHSGKYMERVHMWFERYGRWTLFFGYFVVGVRHFTAVVAGASKMRMRHFAMYAYSGGLIWVICFVSLGYFFGRPVVSGGASTGGDLAALARWSTYTPNFRNAQPSAECRQNGD